MRENDNNETVVVKTPAIHKVESQGRSCMVCWASGP